VNSYSDAKSNNINADQKHDTVTFSSAHPKKELSTTSPIEVTDNRFASAQLIKLQKMANRSVDTSIGKPQVQTLQRVVVHSITDTDKSRRPVLDTTKYGWKRRLQSISDREELIHIHTQMQSITSPDAYETDAFSIVTQKLKSGPLESEKTAEVERLPPFKSGDIVQDKTEVGIVEKDLGDQVLVRWVRLLSDAPDSQRSFHKKAELTERMMLVPSTAEVSVALPQMHVTLHHAGDDPFGNAVREHPTLGAPKAAAKTRFNPHLPQAKGGDGQVMPKDSSFVPETMHMQYNPADPAGAEHIDQMASIGLLEGYVVEVLIHTEDQDHLLSLVSAEAESNIQFTLSDSRPRQWAEDSGEFHQSGAVHVPHLTSPGQKTDPQQSITASRDQRGYLLNPNHRTDSSINRIGADVASGSRQSEKISVGTGRESEVYENTSYIEGGNMLTGTHANGQPYALIGLDSVAATRQIIAGTIGNPESVDIQRVRETIALDIGIDPRFIYFVEQPGEFHLDMGMVVMAPGQVVLNDALKVYELQQQWMIDDLLSLRDAMDPDEWLVLEGVINSELAKMASRASVSHGYESRVALAITQIPGLTLRRVAANFPGTSLLPLMNFLNGESGRGRDDSPFFVTNGGDARAEAYVAEQYLFQLDTGLKRVYFLDPRFSSLSLKDQGGIGCRTKGEGRIKDPSTL